MLNKETYKQTYKQVASQIMPRMRSSNTLGNVGSLLQDAVDTTEDIALRSKVGKKSELSGLTPAMRMAIMRNRKVLPDG